MKKEINIRRAAQRVLADPMTLADPGAADAVARLLLIYADMYERALLNPNYQDGTDAMKGLAEAVNGGPLCWVPFCECEDGAHDTESRGQQLLWTY